MVGVPPTGTVSFLFTDVEQSTQLWEARPDEMANAMARHDQIVRVVMAAHRGHVFSTSGDGFAVAFWTPQEAVASAVEAQAMLAAEPWPLALTITVRIGIHTGAGDATGVQAPAKIGRGRRTDAYLTTVSPDHAEAWRAQGAAMATDQAVAYARRVLAGVLG